jgi:hypothetical protein
MNKSATPNLNTRGEHLGSSAASYFGSIIKVSAILYKKKHSEGYTCNEDHI